MRAALLLLLLGCQPASPPAPRAAPPAGRSGTLVVAQSEDLDNLDPPRMFGFGTFLAPYLYETLVDYGPGIAPDPTHLRPALAESWTISPDGLRYTFHLRQAVFSDGEPVLAADFLHALARARAPETGSPVAGFLARVASASAVDDRTIELRLSAPEPALLHILTMRALAPQKADRPELGAGPFVVADWIHGRRIRLRRNPRYWDAARTRLGAIVFELQVPPEVTALKFHRGDSDLMMNPPADEWIRIAGAPAWAPYVSRLPLVHFGAEALNTRRPPFDDRRVRQALNYALNKEDLVRLSNGRAILGHGVIPPGLPGHDAGRPPYPHDPARARALLAEAGHADGFDMTYLTTAYRQREAVSIQADLAQVGIRARIMTVHPLVFYTLVVRGEFDMAPTEWTMDFLDPWDFLEVKFHSRMIANGTNDSFYANAELDALLDRAHGELDPTRRAALYLAADRLVFAECPVVFESHRVWVDVRQPYVLGYRPHPVWGPDLREAWLER